MTVALTPQKLSSSFSVADLFAIGIGPSSSHTVGPMRAAFAFANDAKKRGTPTRIVCDLFGFLALTGREHSTDTAVILGLAGWSPERVEPSDIDSIVADIRRTRMLHLGGESPLKFDVCDDIRFLKGEHLPDHANALRLRAEYGSGRDFDQLYYSVGGGTVISSPHASENNKVRVKYPFNSGEELIRIGRETGLTISEIMWANEEAWRTKTETKAFLESLRIAMMACIERGCRQDGVLPGGLHVRRRAKSLHEKLLKREKRSDPSDVFEWVSLYALAVNEENASGGRVVTAPTNGAAGILPAVLKYYDVFKTESSPQGALDYLMAGAAIGLLYKARASLSSAELGCQGEIGVACSMAAAGLVSALGGTNEQIEIAAVIAMEHNLGLTCDPVRGLVQIPCIERNTMGAVKAINAAYLALQGDGRRVISLDAVIETMRQTGNDMRSKYKETSQGRVAVNVVEC